jgi:hypothetical protein
MNGFSKSYTASLIAANVATAGVMYLLSSPVFTAVLATTGLVILLAAALTEEPEPHSGSTTADWSQQI